MVVGLCVTRMLSSDSLGPRSKLGATSLAPALASAGLPQAAAATAVMGQTTDGYGQLRSQLPEYIYHKQKMDLPFNKIIVDSRHADFGNSNSFEIRLPEAISLPYNAVCYVCDLQVTNTFSSVDPNKTPSIGLKVS